MLIQQWHLGFTRSILDFGYIFYDFAFKKRLFKVDIFQFKAFRMYTRCNTALYEISLKADETPVSIRRQLLAEKFIPKKAELSNHLILNKNYNLTNFKLTTQYWKRNIPHH